MTTSYLKTWAHTVMQQYHILWINIIVEIYRISFNFKTAIVLCAMCKKLEGWFRSAHDILTYYLIFFTTQQGLLRKLYIGLASHLSVDVIPILEARPVDKLHGCQSGR